MFKFTYKYFILILFIYSCANIVTPTGGPKDTDPPVVVKSIPENGAVHFKKNNFILNFNEFFTLNNPDNQIFISPALESPLNYKLKGKQLQLFFNDPLEENTTYTVNFGNSIKDITENNIQGNFQYVFSTGPFLDSISISGHVQIAENLQNGEEILVMLYKTASDSDVYKHKPFYVGKTNKLGEFSIKNIRDGQYNLFALEDINGNYIYDLPDERIAFCDTALILNSASSYVTVYKNAPTDSTIDTATYKKTANKIILSLFKEDRVKQGLLVSSKKNNQKIVFVFNKPVIDLQILDFNGIALKNIIKEYGKKQDTLACWFYKPPIDTLKLILKDASNIDDTAKFDFTNHKENKELGNIPLKHNINFEEFQDLGKPLVINFPAPLKIHNMDKILIFEDSINPITPTCWFKDSTFNTLNINFAWKENKQYYISLNDSVFTDIYERINSKIEGTFRMKQNNEYGNLKVKITKKDTQVTRYSHEIAKPLHISYIIQLLGSDGKIIDEKQQIKLPHIVDYFFLNPSTYKLKITEDKNSNGKWDTGNYLNKIQPEKIYFYPLPIELRANWDMVLEINLDEL